jgi:hypothetical protein
MTPSRIEPATFWFVVQCLNQLCHPVPPDSQAKEKYPNLRICLKSWVRWMRVLQEGFLSIVAVIPSVPKADLVGYLYIKYFYNVHLICFI